MDDERLSKQLLYGHVATGTRRQGHLQTQRTNNLAASNPSSLATAANPATSPIPATDDHTVAAPPPSVIDIIRPPSTPASTTAISTANTATLRTPPTGGTSPNVPSQLPSPPPHLLLRGLGPNLFSSRSHIHLKNQPD
ncbi:hypothetical protein SprV_0100349200 [Sparganum proliferum]